MEIQLAIFAFILGAIIGSFLNVVILRYNTGRSIQGRSGCLHCNYQLRWYDLIPILSWLYLRGRCRKCQAKISIQYPLVELGTATLFLALFYHLQNYFIEPLSAGALFIWYAIIFSILIVIFVYDLRHKIIPDKLVFTFAGLAFLQTLFLIFVPAFAECCGLIAFNLPADLLNLLAGPIMALPFALLWLISGGRWIGFGDAKLALGIGWFLGFVYGLSAIILAFWIGAIVAIIILLIDKLNKSTKNITMKTEIPFAPFLIIGLIIEFFWQIDFLSLNLFLN